MRNAPAHEPRLSLSELKSTLRSVADIVRNRGFDVTPLRKWVAEVVDADKVCHSGTDFFIVTYSPTDHQELELKASDLDKDELCDMLLASTPAGIPAGKARRQVLRRRRRAGRGTHPRAGGKRLQGHHRPAHLRLRH